MPPKDAREEHPPVPPSPPEPPQDPNALKQIRTFQGDVASVLHQQNASLYSIQQAEMTKKAEAAKMVVGGRVAPVEQEDTQGFKRGILLFFGTLVLIALASGIGWYGFKEYKKKTDLPVIAVPVNRFIASEITKDVDVSTLDRAGLVELIQGARVTQKEGVIHFLLKRGELPLTSTEFFVLLGARAPGSLVRSFDPRFMLGTLEGDPAHAFVLIELDSFENAYAGMLTWENSMRDDVLPLFATEQIIASTSPNAVFEDLTVQNKDARVLRDEAGNIVLLYTFFDNNMLIITDSQSTLRSLIQRLSAEKLVQ